MLGLILLVAMRLAEPSVKTLNILLLSLALEQAAAANLWRSSTVAILSCEF